MKKRFYAFSALICFLFSLLIGRIGYIAFGDAYAVSEGYNSVSLEIDRRDYNLYYCDLKPLTNNVIRRVAVLRPNEKAVGELGTVFDADEVKEILDSLSRGKPTVRTVAQDASLKYSRIYNATATKITCRQLIGKDCGGLLSVLDSPAGVRKVNFSVDALGRMLSGDEGTLIEDKDYASPAGMVLTLDHQVQSITYNACKKLQSGCALVLDTNSASVLACVTKPDTSYLNKCFTAYPVGSVFKMLVAACALENGVDLVYNCTASVIVGDTTYSCQKNKAHGVQHMKDALANSCNCYFVRLALTLGPEKLSQTMQKFGLFDRTELYPNFAFSNAAVPSRQELRQKGELALLGFGQGKLTATPAAMAGVLCAIASGGVYRPINLIAGRVSDDGTFSKVAAANGKRAMEHDESRRLMLYLRGVVAHGTAAAADYQNKSAGKTATAQTGQFQNGREVLNTWFAGVYPYDAPRFVIVIMCENGTSGAADCCPIFRTIVENLDRL